MLNTDTVKNNSKYNNPRTKTFTLSIITIYESN